MINTLETNTSQAFSGAAMRHSVSKEALPHFTVTKVRDGAPNTAYRPPLATPNYIFGLKTEIQKQGQDADTPTAPNPLKAASHSHPEHSPASQAQSIVLTRAGDFPAELTAIEVMPPRRSGGGVSIESRGLPGKPVSDEIFEYPRLDASWKIIPTAEFDMHAHEGSVELLV